MNPDDYIFLVSLRGEPREKLLKINWEIRTPRTSMIAVKIGAVDQPALGFRRYDRR